MSFNIMYLIWWGKFYRYDKRLKQTFHVLDNMKAIDLLYPDCVRVRFVVEQLFFFFYLSFFAAGRQD